MINTLILNPPILRSFRLNFSFKIIWILAFLITLSLLIVCIFQLNAYTREIYLIQDYENGLNQLSHENKILEIRLSTANSLNNIEGYLQNQVFEKVGRVEYIQLLEGTALAK